MSVQEVMTGLADAVRNRFSVTGKFTVAEMTDIINTGVIDNNASKLIDRSITDITIPSDITEISAYAFASSSKLANVIINDNIASINTQAFKDCSALATITIPASVTDIAADAFIGCTNLTDIYCLFEEGVVANAPWGAVNATVHYIINSDYLKLLAQQAEDAALIAASNAEEVNRYVSMMEELRQQVS